MRGVLALEIATGAPVLFACKAVILCTGGAGRVYRQNTKAGIVTGDGMALAFRHGVALRDMEFVQYHPTALPGSGILITEGVVTLFDLAPMVGGAIFGLLYAPLVITGMHHMFLAVDLQLISTQGGTFIWPMIVMSNLAQGSAALAVFWMTRNARDKSMASTSAISAYFGITEPAMFGVNLRYKFPFYAALTGSALGCIFLHYGNFACILGE